MSVGAVEEPQPILTDLDFIMVGSSTSAKSLAEQIVATVHSQKVPRLRCIGNGSIGQAVKAATLARGSLALAGYEMNLVTGFKDVVGNRGDRLSAVVITCRVSM